LPTQRQVAFQFVPRLCPLTLLIGVVQKPRPTRVLKIHLIRRLYTPADLPDWDPDHELGFPGNALHPRHSYRPYTAGGFGQCANSLGSALRKTPTSAFVIFFHRIDGFPWRSICNVVKPGHCQRNSQHARASHPAGDCP